MRIRMIENMRLVGLADRTPEVYVQAVADWALLEKDSAEPESTSRDSV